MFEIEKSMQEFISYKESLNKPELNITFFGAFKAGKSTLLNALTGVKLLPSRVNRATGVITKISYADTPSAQILFKDEHDKITAKNISIDDIYNYILLDIQNGTSKNIENIKEVTVCIPLQFLKYCNLIDTPGLRDNDFLDNLTNTHINSTDLGVFVLSADKLLSSDEKLEAKRVNELLHGNVVFIINRIDTIDEDEKSEVISWAKKLLCEMGNNIIGKPKLFCASASSTLSLKTNQDSDDIILNYSEGLLDFENWIKQCCENANFKNYIYNTRYEKLKIYSDKLESFLKTEISLLENNLDKLKERQRAISLAKSNELKSKVYEIKYKLDSMCDGFENEAYTLSKIYSDTKEHYEEVVNEILGCADKYGQNLYNKINMRVFKEVTIPKFSLNTKFINMVRNKIFSIPETTPIKYGGLLKSIKSVLSQSTDAEDDVKNSICHIKYEFRECCDTYIEETVNFIEHALLLECPNIELIEKFNNLITLKKNYNHYLNLIQI